MSSKYLFAAFLCRLGNYLLVYHQAPLISYKLPKENHETNPGYKFAKTLEGFIDPEDDPA